MLFRWVQTGLPLTLPDINLELSAFLKECYSLENAQRLVRMSRTGFFRFRSDYGIRTTIGRKVHGAEIVHAFELARGRPGVDPVPPLREYAMKLLRRREVCAHLGFELTSLYQLRIRHPIPLLPGGLFHADDIIAALEAERRGEHRVAGLLPVRIVNTVRGEAINGRPVFRIERLLPANLNQFSNVGRRQVVLGEQTRSGLLNPAGSPMKPLHQCVGAHGTQSVRHYARSHSPILLVGTVKAGRFSARRQA